MNIDLCALEVELTLKRLHSGKGFQDTKGLHQTKAKKEDITAGCSICPKCRMWGEEKNKFLTVRFILDLMHAFFQDATSFPY